MGKRVLVLGIPGVQKTAASQALAKELADMGHVYEVINFERDFLWGKLVKDQAAFLGCRIELQHALWERSWKECMKVIDEHSEKNYLLTMHGCYITAHYGARCVFDPGVVARDYKPSLIFTLIADIYDAWSRTHEAAAGYKLKGDPTLAQLLFARRTELLVGDQIALASPINQVRQRNHTSYPQHVKNLCLSVYHPLQTFLNAICSSDAMSVVYLSFPISQPRTLEEGGDLYARKVISGFIREVYLLQHHNKRLVVQCPLAIDELPFRKFFQNIFKDIDPDTPDETKLSFDRTKARWSLEEIFGNDTMLASPPEKLQAFTLGQVREALEVVFTDVTLRDYRLVDQADFLAVFNPIITATRTTMAKSVLEEIHRAIKWQIPVFLFQDSQFDPQKYTLNQLAIDPDNAPTMEGESSQDFIVPCDHYHDLIKHIQKGGLLS